ncbi:MAG: tetratricopeptide repeat protein, partial [Sulfuricella sp.]
NNLGTTFNEQGKLDEAVACYRKALALNPDFAGSHYNLGITLKIQGRLDEAITCCRKALALKPGFPEAYNQMGIALNEQGKFDEAASCYRQALALRPGYTDAYNNLGITLRDQGKLHEAIACYQKTLELKPDFAAACSNLASIFRMLGRNNEATELYRAALKSKPTCDMHTALIFTLDLAEQASVLDQQNERKQWAETYAAPFSKHYTHSNNPAPERRLRIGYVSATIGGSGFSSTKVFGAMLAKFDHSKFDVIVYSNLRSEDETALYYKQRVTGWKMIVEQSDDAVAELIRQDEIDILVDLSGHCAGNRLQVFARKPAPVQVTAWGYPTGTGMRAMDALFADPVFIQPDEKHFFTEEVRYLPSAIGYFHPEKFPDVEALPALSVDHITFGLFNRLAKISDECFDVWVRLLLSIPKSRLLVKTTELEDPDVKTQLLGRFAKAGVDIERVSLLGRTSWFEHMNAFNQIDIALDPFPQCGGVTTMECLMMGNPIITLRWTNLVGRASASILTTLGMTDWVAETPEQYIAIAIEKTRDLEALATFRQQLRSRFTSSVIGDAHAYVKAAESEYRQLWREWCERKINESL